MNSLVAGIAASGDVSAATAAGSARIEVENNQVAPMAPVPGWLAGFKLPGYKGETASKGDGVIADPATELDPSIKTGALVTPTPGPGIIETLITAATPDWLRNLVTDAVTMAGDGPGNATLSSGGDNAQATDTTVGADSAANAANGTRLNNQLAAEQIANGHAFDKHVIDQNEFGGSITTQQQFADQVESILNNPSATKQLSNGRSAYWDDTTGIVVIRNPNAADGGTAFKPTNGKTYFNNLR